MAILRPRVAAAALGNDRAELGIGQHIDPRGWRCALRSQRHDIFAPVRSKAAESIFEDKLLVRNVFMRRGGAPAGNKGGNGGIGEARTLHLLRQRAVFINQDNACDGLEEGAILRGHLFHAADEDATGFIQKLGFGSGGDQADDLIVQGKSIVSVGTLGTAQDSVIPALKQELDFQAARQGEIPADGFQVTIMGDREIPYWLLKQIMLTCQNTAFTQISLAVNRLEVGASGLSTPAVAAPGEGVAT